MFMLILILLLLQGQTGGAWEPANKALLFLMVSGITGQKGMPTFRVVWSSDV
jgi:uncharacterized membrane protein